MANSIAIVTDSTNDLPLALRQQYDVNVVPLYILWGDETLRDGVDVLPEDFYARMQREPEARPKTSLPTPGDFVRVFEEVLARGAKEIVTLTISSAMSGTIQAARQAAEMISAPVHFVDSRSNSMSLGWQILAAARVREQGGDAAAMVAAADRVRQKLVYIIALDTLDYLFAGGRIGGAISFLGQVLKIKPQISVNHQTGKVEAGEPARTRAHAIETLYRNFFKRVDSTRPLHIAVLHNAAFEEAEALAERVRQEFSPVELLTSIVSPVLGVHTGPRAIALCGYAD
jgi:DegV family protein with EDD domain